MHIRVNLDLPRDARFVPVMRNVADRLLQDIGAPVGAIDDIQLALSEACANVVRHAEGSQSYHVTLAVEDGGCEIEVADNGPGFATQQVRDQPQRRVVPGGEAALDAETGRGLRLMQSLMDDLFIATAEGDNVVRLRKQWPPIQLPGQPRSSDALAHAPSGDHASG